MFRFKEQDMGLMPPSTIAMDLKDAMELVDMSVKLGKPGNAIMILTGLVQQAAEMVAGKQDEIDRLNAELEASRQSHGDIVASHCKLKELAIEVLDSPISSFPGSTTRLCRALAALKKFFPAEYPDGIKAT
jgi:hypothetical protein